MLGDPGNTFFFISQKLFLLQLKADVDEVVLKINSSAAKAGVQVSGKVIILRDLSPTRSARNNTKTQEQSLVIF